MPLANPMPGQAPQVRHDGPGGPSQDVVDFKSTPLKPLDLRTRVV